MKFHAKLRKLIEGSPVNQTRAGRQLGIDSGRMTRLKQGRGNPTVDDLLKLSRFFGVSMEWLADDEMDEPPAAGPAAHIHPTVLDLLGRLSTQAAIDRLSLIDDDERAQDGPPPADAMLPTHRPPRAAPPRQGAS